MSRIADRLLHVTGWETSAERRKWEERRTLLKSTVLFPYSNAAFEDEIKLLETLEGSVSFRHVVYKAEERVRLRALCLGRCALPEQGINDEQLRSLGFELGAFHRVYSGLRLVGFPVSWTMEPLIREPSIDHAGEAVVHDETGAERINVLFERSIVGMIRNQSTAIIT